MAGTFTLSVPTIVPLKATPTPRKGTVKDQDYRDPGFANVTSKGLTVRWTPGHRELKQATTYRNYKDIIGNNDSDTVANMRDNLPMELPPRHGAPWERIPTLCGTCGTQHGGSVQMRLAYCPTWSMFWTDWVTWWIDWSHHAQEWLRTATHHERSLCARLLIPHSLVGIFPQQERHKFRSLVGLFQFRALQGVHEPRRKLADPTPDLGPSTLWITRFTGTQCTPRETPQNLRDRVGAPTGTQKRKRTPNDEAPLIDVDLWLHEACPANDDGAVQWFTKSVIHTNPPPQTANKRARHHDTLLAQATQHLTNLENLTMRHLRLVTNMYNRTHLCEQTMHHIRNLRDMYDSAIAAKRKYHALQASLAQDHLRKTRTEHQYLQYCTDVAHTYEVAKQTARQLYEDGFNYLRLTRRYTIHIIFL